MRPAGFLSLLSVITAVLIFNSACSTYPAPQNFTSSALSSSLPSALPARKTAPAPSGGYTWQQLADMAVAASSDYTAMLSDARAEYYRQKSKNDPNDLQLSFESSYFSSNFDNNPFNAGIQVPFPNPFIGSNVNKAGIAAQRELEANAETFKNQITSTVYKYVQQILIGEKTLSVLRLRDQVNSDRADNLQKRYDSRVATQADMLQFDIQRLRLRSDILQAQSSVQTARRDLALLVQIPDEQLVLNTVSVDWDAVQAALANDQFIETAVTNSAELAASWAAYEKACALLDTAKAKQIPWFRHFSLTYSPAFSRSVDTSVSPPLYIHKRSDNFTMGLNVNLPVFAWFSAEKQAAIIGVETASQGITGTDQRIRGSITDIVTNLQGFLQILSDYRAVYDTVPEPSRDNIIDLDSYYKLTDDRLSASQYALGLELQCANLYGNLLKLTGNF